MLDKDTRSRIDTARDILVGKVPDPKSQVEQITIALIYKFMDDMDMEAEELGGKRTFFSGKYEQFAWSKLMSREHGGDKLISLYSEAIQKMDINPNIPQLFRDIFKNAYLPYRDPETLRLFLSEINKFSYDHSEKLGDAFEYLLSVLGSQGDAGQFRTPRHIIDFMVEIADPKKNETIIDPACGTAGFLISSYKHILKINSSNYKPAKDVESFDLKGTDIKELPSGGIKRYSGDRLTPDDRTKLSKNIKGYDISPDMVRLSLVNLYLHGFSDPHIFEYDTLTSEEKWNEFGDVILANPPFMSPKGGIKPHKRFSVQSNRSEVLFVDYIAEHLAPTGRAAVIVPEGIIFQSGTAYKKLRKMLVDDYLFCVVSLPAGVFNPYSGVKTSILLMDRKLSRLTDTILFVKVNNDGFDLGAQRRPVENSDLPEALRVIKQYKENLLNEVEEFKHESPLALVVPKRKLAENDDYNLTGERYRVSEVRKNQKWPMVKLGEICEINPKKSEVSSFDMNLTVSFIPMEDIGTEQKILPKKEKLLGDVYKGYTYFRDNDVLVAKVTPCFENGKSGITRNLKNGIGFGSSELHVIRTTEQILPEFIYPFVSSKIFINNGKVKMTGTGGLQRVPVSYITDFKIPLPPLEVQKEIVAEIEGYQKIIDGARQVVDNWKPRIDIDPDWPVVKLGEVCEIVSGYGFESKDFSPNNPVKCIKITNVGVNEFINDDASNLPKDFIKKHENFIAKTGDIIISLTRSIISSGLKVTTVPSLWNNSLVNQRVAVIKQKDNINITFIFNYLTSETVYKYVEEKSKSLMQPNLSINDLKALTVPYPSQKVQQEIVSGIESERKAVDGCRELIKIYEGKIKMVIDKVWEG